MEETRAFLTDKLVQGGLSDDLVTSIKTLRFATMEGLDALERWQRYCSERTDAPTDDESWLAAAEDLKASVSLFRLTIVKVMQEVAAAHDLTFEAR